MRKTKYSPTENPEKFFDLRQCPLCGHDQIFVEKTTRPVRRYKCSKCRNSWKGIMVFLAYENALDAVAECYRAKTEVGKSLGFL